MLHYLSGEPIDAKRDSTWYMLRKSLRRHRVVVATGAAFVVTIAAALVVSLAFWHQAVTDRDTAVAAKKDAQAAQRAERQQREESEFSTYVASIAAAEAALRLYDVQDARTCEPRD